MAYLFLVRCMSVNAIIRRWPIASWLFVLHTFLVLLVYYVWLTSTEPWGERNMIWLWIYRVDFPISYAYIIVDHAPARVTAIACILIGGVQWSIVGLLLDLLRKKVLRRTSIRGTSNI